MTLWWIGDVVLLLVILPVVVYLLRGVLDSGPQHRPERARDLDRAPPPAPRTSTPRRCC